MTVLTVGLDDADERLQEARALRACGERFVCRFVVPPPRPVRVLRATAEYLALADPRERREAIERLGVVEEIPPSPGARVESGGRRSAIFAEIADLSDGGVAYTHEERRIVDMVLERTRSGVLRTRLASAVPSPSVPRAIERARRPGALVLWAPHDDAWIASLAAYALQEAGVPIVVVCRGGTLPNVRAEYAGPSDGAAALERALGVIDLSLHDPGEALALATLGIPLAVSYLSGAYELLENVAIFRPWVERDIALAAAMLPALGPPQPRGDKEPAERHGRVFVFGGAVSHRWAEDGVFSRTTIVADAGSALEALDCAVRLRRAGERFDVALALDESYTTTELHAKATLRDLALLSETLVTRAWADVRRAFLAYDLVKRDVCVTAIADSRVPAPLERTSGESIVVWAPDHSDGEIADVLTAARATGRRTVAICAQSAPQTYAAALQECAVCVAAAPTDPSGALALAPWRIPLCAPLTSGAHEWLDGVHAYRPWNAASMRAAIDDALRVRLPPTAVGTSDARRAGSSRRSSAARVCVVVRAHGRPRWSLATHVSIERQTLPAVELRTVSTPAELCAAADAGDGDYVAVVEDGDVLYDDCLASLADALDRTGAGFAYGDALLAYVVPGRGDPDVLGFSVMERKPLIAAELLGIDVLAGTYFRVLYRREALAAAGGIRAEFDELAMAEASLRLRLQGPGAYVDRVAGMAHRHLDGTSPARAATSLRDEYRRLFARYAVADARVANTRDAVLAHLAAHPAVSLRPPPLRLHPPVPLFAGA